MGPSLRKNPRLARLKIEQVDHDQPQDAARVYVVEGERCVDAANGIGLTSTTSPHGANGAKKTHWGPLAGKEVVILPDNDEAGRKYAEDAAGLLQALKPPAQVNIVELLELP